MMSIAHSKIFHIDSVSLDFDLPENLIAQEPIPDRDQARLLVLNRETGSVDHRLFSDMEEYLKAGDVLVINKARVNKAKVIGHKETGGRVEVIFIEATVKPFVWRALVRPLLKKGTKIIFGSGAFSVLEGRTETGENILRIEGTTPLELMEKEGEMPLPPYIKRNIADPRKKRDEMDYQTVYASVPGSIAAPTAGLHFSESILERLIKKGVVVAPILLHVGWGTFKPIANSVDSHRMLGERFEVAPAVFAEIKAAREQGRRIITVGTTSTRVIESLALNSTPENLTGETNLFIKPGFRFLWTNGLITNLHVPRSTPVSLAAAFAGLTALEKAYSEAIRFGYRFFSYGDAMLVI